LSRPVKMHAGFQVRKKASGHFSAFVGLPDKRKRSILALPDQQIVETDSISSIAAFFSLAALGESAALSS
jgi:hypothetical protein